MRWEPIRWPQVLVAGGSLAGLVGTALYLAAATGLAALEEVEIGNSAQTALFVVLLGTPYLLALWGMILAGRRRALGLTFLAVAAVFSLVHVLLAALSVFGLLFLLAATLLCGGTSLFFWRSRGDVHLAG